MSSKRVRNVSALTSTDDFGVSAENNGASAEVFRVPSRDEKFFTGSFQTTFGQHWDNAANKWKTNGATGYADRKSFVAELKDYDAITSGNGSFAIEVYLLNGNEIPDEQFDRTVVSAPTEKDAYLEAVEVFNQRIIEACLNRPDSKVKAPSVIELQVKGGGSYEFSAVPMSREQENHWHADQSKNLIVAPGVVCEA